MTLNQIKYVVAVVNSGSINQAAANLFVSQSVLSTAISNLEKEIGRAIFIRNSRGVTLTPFGHTFTSYVSAIQTQLEQLDKIILRGAGEHTFSLSIASTGYFFLSRICTEIFEKYRALGVRVEQYEDHENNIADMISHHTAEIGLVRIWSCYKKSFLKQLAVKKIQYYAIAQLDVAVTVGKKNPLFYSDSDRVTCAELRDFPAVMTTNIDSGPYSDIYERLKIPISNNRFVTSSRSTIYETLDNTDCYYLNSKYPPRLLSEEHSDFNNQYRTLILSDCGIKSEIAWIKRADYALTPIANEVIDMIMSRFEMDILD